MFDRALEYATHNAAIAKLLLQLGLDPSNITYNAIFDLLQDMAVDNLTFSNILAFAGALFLLSTFVVRTIVLMRVLCIFSIVFFLGSAALAYSIPKFLMYLLALPINIVRLVQIRHIVKTARSAAQGTLSMDWLRPFMTPRTYKKGDVLFRKGDPGTEMLMTVTGKFLVTEIGIEIPAGRMLGELGFISPDNKRTQSVECIEDAEVLTITYDRLLEIYFENPEFGYFFLRLVSDRLLQNHARLEAIIAQDNEKLRALTAPKPAVAAAAKPSSVLRGMAASRLMKKPQFMLRKPKVVRQVDNSMFARLKRFSGKVLSTAFYWIASFFAVLVLLQAIVLALVLGNPFVPLLLGAAAVVVWLIALGVKTLRRVATP
jgi:CRP-like cAMP-binding protein